MSTQDWTELLKVLGVAGPIVVLLGWLVRENTSERKEITAHYLSALTTIVSSNDRSMQSNTAAVQEMSTVMREHIAHSEREHERIIEKIEHSMVRRTDT